MKTLNLHTSPETHAPKSASQKARDLESVINKLMAAAAVVVGAALLYGMLSGSATPSYFH